MAVSSSTSGNIVSATKENGSQKTKKRSQAIAVVDADNDNGNKAKRAKCPGVRVVGNRIYDSEKGKTCHQCRQKTMDFTASCKNVSGDKLCTIKFCHKCLLNRYGEKAEEVEMLDDWRCPRCRGICNCSFCMKKRGHKPTGQLFQTARNAGYSSVSEMLNVAGSDNLGHEKVMENVDVLPTNPVDSNKGPEAVPPRKLGKENSFDGKTDADSNSQKSITQYDEKSKKKKREGLKEVCNGSMDEGAKTKKSSPIKPKSPEDLSKKEVKIGGTNRNSLSANQNSKTQDLKDDARLRTIKSDEEKVGKTPEDEGALNAVKNENKNVKANPKKVPAPCKVKKCTMNLENREVDANIALPEGASVATVADIDLPPGDVGYALQLLEFCASFGKVLDIKKGQGEALLRELRYGRRGRRAQYSMTAQFHIQLLYLIQKDAGEETLSLSPTNGRKSWWQALGKCISESKCVLKELYSDCFDSGADEYDKLNFSMKLRLLNFLCDEALGTEKLRSWIDDQNSKVVEQQKEAKEKLIAARDKEKRLKQKLQDDVAKAMIAKSGAPLSIAEHEAIVSKVKSEAAQAHAEMLDIMGITSKKRQKSDAVRTEAIFLDVNGRAFWKLKGYTGGQDILLQAMGSWDAAASSEEWFAYGAEQKQAIEEYISSLRSKRLQVKSFAHNLANGSK